MRGLVGERSGEGKGFSLPSDTYGKLAPGLRFLPAIPQALRVARREYGQPFKGDCLGAGDGALQSFTMKMTLGRFLQVLVPDVGESVVEADALEAVVKPQGPAVLARKCRKSLLSQLFEVGNACCDVRQDDGSHGQADTRTCS